MCAAASSTHRWSTVEVLHCCDYLNRLAPSNLLDMNPPSIPFIAGSAALPLYLRGLAIKYYSPERARPSLIPPCLLPSSSISLSCPHKMTTPSLPSISLPLPIAPQSPRLDSCRPVPSLSPFENRSPALSIPYRSARVLQFRFVDPLSTSLRVYKSFLNIRPFFFTSAHFPAILLPCYQTAA